MEVIDWGLAGARPSGLERGARRTSRLVREGKWDWEIGRGGEAVFTGEGQEVLAEGTWQSINMAGRGLRSKTEK